MREKAEVISDLGVMLADVFMAKERGEAYGRLARAHGYVDGYMRALIDLGFATKEELVDLVNAERERSCGPAMRPIANVVDSTSAAA